MSYKVFGVIGRAHVHLAIEANDHACFGWGDGELVARERDAKTSIGEAEHLVACCMQSAPTARWARQTA